MTQIKPFHFDPMKTNPTDIARRDYLEFFIEEILDMEGNISQYGTLRFKVKWLNYPQENNTWELWLLEVLDPIQPIRCCFHISTFMHTSTSVAR